MIRTVLAFILAPLIPALALLRDAGPMIAFVYAYVLTYLFGIPVFLTLRRKKMESHARYAAYGATAAALVMICIFFLGGGVDLDTLLITLIMGVVGGLEGLLFSAIRGVKNNLP